MLTSAFRSAAISSSRRVAVLVRNGAPSSTFVRFFSTDLEDDQVEDPVRESVAKELPTPVGKLPIDFADISRAEVAIRGGVRRTSCEKSHFISELVGANVFFKNEFCQFTGSFKERGARNAILQLKREKGSSLRGVIAASAGNHALALAYHGKELGVPVTVVMPTVAPMAKVDKCRVSSLLIFDRVVMENPASVCSYIFLTRLVRAPYSPRFIEIRSSHHHQGRTHRGSEGVRRDFGSQ
jgi:hypothetical protein